MIANLAIGMVTPPVGVNLFVASRVGNIPLERLMRSAAPFLVVMLLILALITYVPALSLGLPALFGM